MEASIILFVLVILVTVVIVLNSTSYKLNQAEKRKSEGKYSEAEEIYRDILHKSPDAPRLLSDLLLTVAKKSRTPGEKAKVLKKALEISESGLQDVARDGLRKSRKKVIDYICEIADRAFQQKKYDDAVELVDVLSGQGPTFTDKGIRFRAYKYGAGYLKSGDKRDVKSFLDTYSADAKKYLSEMGASLLEEKKYEDAASILELLDDETSKRMWEQAVLNYVVLNGHLIKKKGGVDQHQLEYAESYADSLKLSSLAQRETKLTLLKAVYQETLSLSVQEKIQTVFFETAKEHLDKDDYQGFKSFFKDMETGCKLEEPARKKLLKAYLDKLYHYLSDNVTSFQHPSEKWDDLEDSIKRFAATDCKEDVISLSRKLTSQKRYQESAIICQLLEQQDPEVKKAIINNIESSIIDNKGGKGIPAFYSNPEFRPEIFNTLFSDALSFSKEGHFAEALSIFKGIESDLVDAESFYNAYSTTAIDSILSSKSSGQQVLRLGRTLLDKLGQKHKRDELIEKLEKHFESLYKQGDFSSIYFIGTIFKDVSPNLSRLFLESVVKLVTQGFAPSKEGLLEEINKQPKPLDYLSRLHEHYPDTLRAAYIERLGDEVELLFGRDHQKAIKILTAESNETVRLGILKRSVERKTPLFKEAVLGILENKERLPENIKELVELIASYHEEAFSIAALKDLTLNGYPAGDAYAKAICKKANRCKKNESKLAIVNEALEVFPLKPYPDLVDIKKGIAQDYIETDPREALRLLDEIKEWTDIRELFAQASLAAAISETDLAKKKEYLKQAFDAASLKSTHQKIEKEIVKLADTYFSLGKQEPAFSVLKEFRCALTDKAYLEKMLNLASKEEGDAAAMELYNEAISFSENSPYSDQLPGGLIASLWDGYTLRVLSKSEKQPRNKAISSLEDFHGILAQRGDSLQENSARIVAKLHDLNMEEGRELEQNGHNKAAYTCYAKANEMQQDAVAVSRKAVCALKRKDIGIDSIVQDVETAIPIAPADIKKDIVYRYILVLLAAGRLQRATELADREFRSPKLRELCESYRLRQAKSQIDELNKKIEELNGGRMGFDDAIQFHSSVDLMVDGIAETYPEHASLKSKYKKTIGKYILHVAFKEQRYETVFALLKKQSNNYLSNETLFRNMAVACLGIIESGGLTDENYKEVLGVWLSAVYSDKLIVKSLDYTSWDDGYTFSLADSLSQTFMYENLPDNINRDAPSESNIGIGQVQKALLERSDAALNGSNSAYYSFYREQIAAMDAMASYQKKNRISEDILSPCIFAFVPDKYRNHFLDLLKNDNSEEAINVGCLYGLTGGLYDQFRIAQGYYAQCLDSLKRLVNVKTHFGTSRISTISTFSGLKKKLVQDARNEFANHKNNGKTYEDLLGPFALICGALNDSQLSYSFSDFINGEIIPKMNANDLDTASGLKVLIDAYTVYEGNAQLNDNIKAILGNLLTEYVLGGSSEAWSSISSVIRSTSSFNGDLIKDIRENPLFGLIDGGIERANKVLDFIRANDSSSVHDVTSAKKALQEAGIQKEMSDLVDKVNKKQIQLNAALQENYRLYLRAKDNQRICQNLAILIGDCILEYILSGKYGVSTVKSTLDQIYNNRSIQLKKETAPFNQRFDALWGNLNYDNRMAVRVGVNLNDNGRRLVSALEYLGKFGTRSISSASLF